MLPNPINPIRMTCLRVNLEREPRRRIGTKYPHAAELYRNNVAACFLKAPPLAYRKETLRPAMP
jgi:hypothetical protein